MGVTHAHAQVIDGDAKGAVCSLPLIVDEKTIGVMTLIREDNKAFDESTTTLLVEIVERIGSVIALKQHDARSWWRRGLKAIGNWSTRLLGAGHLRLKLYSSLALALVLALNLVHTDYQVGARSAVEGAMQQAVVAPFDGYLAEAHVRAGDTVEEGQVLAVLDDREVVLEYEKWSSERDKHGREYQEALANRDRAKVSVVSARIAQTEAQLRLVEDKISRAKIRAPFSGVIASGDLSRALGAPLERGQMLFELVPAEGFRVGLLVDEHDVAAVRTGQPGVLRLAGMPDNPIPLHVTRILPIASADQGGNYFRVEAELQTIPEGLRPGMEGVAKITVGRDSLLWVWTHETVQRLRLWVWSAGF
jgi:multidrug efflux pump subunit AcrA (membrane-fusion protein)